jgi:hypothetical protein
MDGSYFDQLTRAMASPESRRGLRRLLVSLPLTAILASLPGGKESDAKRRTGHQQNTRRVGGENHKHSGRRRKHNLRHKRRHKKHKDNGCRPEPVATTCDGQCGEVLNNCQQVVECDPCNCNPACSACTVCDPETVECVPDPDAVGESCGTGQICNDENQCVPCGGDGQPCCPNGECDGALVCDPQNERCAPASIEFILSGGSDPTTPLRADDDMQVFLNGQIILDDTNGITSEITPLLFRAQPGDILRVIGINVQPVCISLRPLYLHLAGSSGQPQVLDADGVPQSCADHQPGIFYDETFTIALGAAPSLPE